MLAVVPQPNENAWLLGLAALRQASSCGPVLSSLWANRCEGRPQVRVRSSFGVDRHKAIVRRQEEPTRPAYSRQGRA